MTATSPAAERAGPQTFVDRMEARDFSALVRNALASRDRIISDLLAACIASEKERDDNEDYSTSHLCGECNMGTGPHRQTCAHHLRVAAIARARGERT